MEKRERKKIIWYIILSISALIFGIILYETICLYIPVDAKIFGVIPFDPATFTFGLMFIIGAVVFYLLRKRNRRFKEYKNQIDRKRRL